MEQWRSMVTHHLTTDRSSDSEVVALLFNKCYWMQKREEFSSVPMVLGRISEVSH